ncbi:Ras family protein [Legionella massiliensis]|uniref:Ras family protein n=1 Tax=Legionella massiliensis TaxID=1034943 RepID=A0A078KVG8_9GAMM|nr:GTPase domain-containing protein [Legionella massiliensis]CDZ76976.1 Ras family protein [Legionella massiliensis]CEE12714.1 Ras family protein [Legionella massiliensis]
MKFLKHKEKDDVKNVVVLGGEKSGKKSFLLSYKDGQFPDQILPEISNLSYKQTFDGHEHPVIINFKIHGAGDAGLIPSMGHKKQRVDAVLILVDLSSQNAEKDLAYFIKYADTHFKNAKTMLVGTKADLREEIIPDLVETSAKTRQGFEEFQSLLQDALAPADSHNLTM